MLHFDYCNKKTAAIESQKEATQVQPMINTQATEQAGAERHRAIRKGEKMFKVQTKSRRLMMLLSLLCVSLFLSGAAQGKFPTGTYANGQFAFTFGEDGTHSVSADGRVVVKGSYTVTQDQIALTDKEGDYACLDNTGKYKWKVEGKSLKFEKVEDTCDGRVSALSGSTWEKK